MQGHKTQKLLTCTWTFIYHLRSSKYTYYYMPGCHYLWHIWTINTARPLIQGHGRLISPTNWRLHTASERQAQIFTKILKKGCTSFRHYLHVIISPQIELYFYNQFASFWLTPTQRYIFFYLSFFSTDEFQKEFKRPFITESKYGQQLIPFTFTHVKNWAITWLSVPNKIQHWF